MSAEVFEIREWAVRLTPVCTARGERWLAYAEHTGGNVVPPGGPDVPLEFAEAKETFDRLVAMVK